jgi:hypothetical protein
MAKEQFGQSVTIRYPCNNDSLPVGTPGSPGPPPIPPTGFPVMGTASPANNQLKVHLWTRASDSNPTQPGSFNLVASQIAINNGSWIQPLLSLQTPGDYYLRASIGPDTNQPPPPLASNGYTYHEIRIAVSSGNQARQ